MAKQQTYCLIEVPATLLLPADIAMELFPLLCHAEPVTYDWQDKTYKRRDGRDYAVTIKQFTIADYAALALNSEPE